MKTTVKLVAWLIIVTAANSCNTTAFENPRSTAIDPQVLLTASGKAMEELQSFHFHLYHIAGATSFASIMLEEVEGNVVNPDMLEMKFEGTIGNFLVATELIALGKMSYLLNPLTGMWEEFSSEVSPVNFFNPQYGIDAIMSSITDPTLVGIESGSYLINGTLSSQTLTYIVGPTLKDVSVSVQLQIDPKNMYLTQVLLKGRLTEGEIAEIERVIAISQFNQPFSIRSPK